ncbi:hypothetical protein [Chitinophaga sp.]|uniref:hypothetical protein n=1 Tax=Chitinophaga sp. TaxID=1869181 RepID=UPI0031E35FE6
MALVKDNLLFQFVRGTIGDQITIYERNGQIIMAKKREKSGKKPTPGQRAAREKLEVAAGYARAVLRDAELKDYYKSKAGPGQSAYNMAIKDAYTSPEVQDVQVKNLTIIVNAKNEFRLAEVAVQVLNRAGKILEKGNATRDRNFVDWYYTAESLPAGGKVKIIATDLPGNNTIKELKLG